MSNTQHFMCTSARLTTHSHKHLSAMGRGTKSRSKKLKLVSSFSVWLGGRLSRRPNVLINQTSNGITMPRSCTHSNTHAHSQTYANTRAVNGVNVYDDHSCQLNVIFKCESKYGYGIVTNDAAVSPMISVRFHFSPFSVFVAFVMFDDHTVVNLTFVYFYNRK